MAGFCVVNGLLAFNWVVRGTEFVVDTKRLFDFDGAKQPKAWGVCLVDRTISVFV